MTTLTINTVCKTHTPNLSAISSINDEEYTFCEVCENNIDRFWLEFGGELLDMWSDWSVTK